MPWSSILTAKLNSQQNRSLLM